MSRIYDPKFKYVPAAATDVGATIKREQKRLKAIADAQVKAEAERQAEAERNAVEAQKKVAPMRRASK